MTANRWWVRSFARWKARIGGVQADINLFFAAVRTVSLAGGIMGFFGVPWWVIAILMLAMFGAMLLYAYLYNEGGVRNQVGRDNQVLQSNYSRPIMRIDDEMIARTILAGLRGEPLDEETREAIKTEGDVTFVEYQDGIDLDKFDGW